MEPHWLIFARKFIGKREVPGKESNPWIKSLWEKVKLSWLWKQAGEDDSVIPWCGAFVGAVFVDCGILPAPNPQRARAWLNWGIKLDFPTPGAVVVYERGAGGHVGFVVGQTPDGFLLTLGGNQGDKVSIAPFNRDRVLGYRWPTGTVLSIAPLPILANNGNLSTNES